MNEAKDLIQELCPNGVKFEALSDIATIKTGATINKIMIQNHPGRYPVINSGREPLGFYDNYNVGYDPIGITSRGAGVGSITWYEGKYFRGNLNYSVTIKDTHRLSYRYLYHWLLRDQKRIQSLATYDGIPALNASNLKKLTIPVPPLAVQAEIVRILDSFTSLEAELEAELEARKKQYEYYKNGLFVFNTGVEYAQLGSLVSVLSGFAFKSSEYVDSGIRIIRISDVQAGYISDKDMKFYPVEDKDHITNFLLHENDLVISLSGSVGRVAMLSRSQLPAALNQRVACLHPISSEIDKRFLFHFLNRSIIEHQANATSGGTVKNLSTTWLKKLQIPVPPLDEQHRIVSILDNFDALVNDLSSGLPAEIAARREQYEFYRDRLLSFKELGV